MFEDIFEVPLLGPLLNLLRSRKFLVAVLTLVADMLVAQFPALEPVRVEIITVLTAIGSVLIGAIAFEDGKAKASGTHKTS